MPVIALDRYREQGYEPYSVNDNRNQNKPQASEQFAQTSCVHTRNLLPISHLVFDLATGLLDRRSSTFRHTQTFDCNCSIDRARQENARSKHVISE